MHADLYSDKLYNRKMHKKTVMLFYLKLLFRFVVAYFYSSFYVQGAIFIQYSVLMGVVINDHVGRLLI